MTLIQLRYLSAIVDAGLSVTAAAQAVHATQSALSKQIKALEEELGFLLFVRRGKSLERLTAGGKDVLAHARALLIEAANIRTLAANKRGDGHGELRIAATYTQTRHVLPAPMAALRLRLPGVRFSLFPGGETDALQALSQDRADLAIISAAERPVGAELALPLYRWRLVGVVPVGHPLARARRLGLADLAAHPLVSYPSLLQPGSSFLQGFEAQGLKPEVACVARDSDLIKTFVRAGLGVGLAAEMAVGDEDDLETFPLGGLVPVRTAWAVLNRERAAGDHILDFLLSLSPRFGRAALRRLLDGEQLAEGAPAPWWGEATWLGDGVVPPVPAPPSRAQHPSPARPQLALVAG